MIATETITNDAALATLETEWWQLWHRSPGATPFQSPAWLLPWWEVFHPGRLCVGAIREDGRLVGLAPFYLEAGESGGRLLPLGISVSDYIDVLLDPAYPTAAAAISRHMADSIPDWREWELTELPVGAAARTLPCPADCDDVMERASICSGITVPTDRSGVASPLPKPLRRKLRLAQNRAARRGELSILEADASNVSAMVADLATLHQRRQQSQGNAGVFQDPRIMEFHQAAAPRLLQAGILRLRAFMIGTQLAAVYYGLLSRGCCYAYLTGFDAEFYRESPSNILLAHAIETAIAEGVSRIDFLRGDENYKSHWGVAFRYNGRRLFRRRGIRHAAA